MTRPISSTNCMNGITIVHVGNRNFRVPTASIPIGFAFDKEVYVRPYNKEDAKIESDKDKEEITLELDIPRNLHGLIIGRGGETVKQLRSETNTNIKVPYYKGPVTISGAKGRVEIAKKRIEDIVGPYNNTENEKSDIRSTKIEVIESININEEITLKLNIPNHLHGLIIGRSGSTLNQIRDETKAKILIPINGPTTISGTKDKVEMAKKRIEDIVESVINF
ncbi:hypothetical protein C1645_477258 [Glomus cerebriforme]|uniref:K Homology domain-containing protein n=1 Tax=Glomus cerebriforme TaxID=658196 RepID=A0A397TLW6_9GLOM|nr:hypothetical protein C1645_477258 [Glomus cerebriforme]